MMIPNDKDIKSGDSIEPSQVVRRMLAVMPRHVAILGYRGESRRSFSVLVANALEKHAVMVWDALPDLTDDEWLVICDTYRGDIASTHGVMSIESAVFGEGYDMAMHLDVDLYEFASRIQEFSICERVAIAEFVDRFWNWKELHCDAKDYAEIIERIKCSIEHTASLGNTCHQNRFSPIAGY